jgi:hypothetical protein
MNLKNIINLSAVFSIYVINKQKDGLGGWEIVSVSVNNHAVCFRSTILTTKREMVNVQTSLNIELFPAFILL